MNAKSIGRGIVWNRDELSGVLGVADGSGVAEHPGVAFGVKNVLGRSLLVMQGSKLLQLRPIAPEERHDLLGGKHLPVVVRGLVAKAREKPISALVVERRGVHVDVRIAETGVAHELADGRAAPVAEIGPKNTFEVADTHVVGGDREIPSTEVRMGYLEI